MPVPVTQTKQKKDKKDKNKKSKKKNTAIKASTPAEIEIAQENVVKYSSRLHITSAVLIAIGAIGAIGSGYHGLNARRMATKFLKPHHMN